VTADKIPPGRGIANRAPGAAGVDEVLRRLLAEIAREDVPERIRELAQQLDRALKEASTSR